MPSVSELVEDVAEVLGERIETVAAYARALIDNGDLPKSRGRAVAQVETQDVVKLVLAVAIAPKIKDASAEVRKYFDILRAGVPSSAPESIRVRAGEQLCVMAEAILGDAMDADSLEFRRLCVDSEIAIILTWPEIEIVGDDTIWRFKESGDPLHWNGYIKRTVTVSGRAFAMLGRGSGRIGAYAVSIAD